MECSGVWLRLGDGDKTHPRCCYRPEWDYNSPFGVHITNCKHLNSDHVIFAMRVKCLANSAEQRKRDKLADIY